MPYIINKDTESIWATSGETVPSNMQQNRQIQMILCMCKIALHSYILTMTLLAESEGSDCCPYMPEDLFSYELTHLILEWSFYLKFMKQVEYFLYFVKSDEQNNDFFDKFHIKWYEYMI